MTYSLFVLISPDSPNVSDEVERLVAPFCLFIDWHETDCSCVVDELERRAHDEVMKQRFEPDSETIGGKATSPWKSRLVGLCGIREKLTPDERSELQELLAWDAQAHLKNSSSYLKALGSVKQQFRAQLDRDLADRGCKLCGGTGKVMCDENPEGGYFDGYAIGGSYTALFAPTLKEHPDAMDGFPVSNEGSDLWQCRDAVVPVRLLDEDCPLPHAVVTPDGTWHEQDDFNTPAEDEDGSRWSLWCDQTFKEHSDCLCILCSYHL